MGKVLSRISNPFKNFNLESRAHKVISQAKPTPAPKHKTDQLDLDRLMKDYPVAYKESLKKNEQLDKRLKDVYVTSQDPNIHVKQDPNPNRPLPSDRATVGDYLFGIKEPDKIPVGKITLRNALKFITNHQSEPRTFTAEKIAVDSSIPAETIRNVLKFYRVFELYIPQERKTKATFAGPSLPKVHILKQLRKQLPSRPEKEEKT